MPTSWNEDIGVLLVHSPLVGTVTWRDVATIRYRPTVRFDVAALSEAPRSGKPFWQQHAEAVAQSLTFGSHVPLVYVAHSGAGALLPAIRERCPNPVAGYIFVDAGLPKANASRLDMMREESPAWAESFHQSLLNGGVFPSWTDDDLRELVPDARRRAELVASIRPRGLPFFTEPIPVFEDWPDAPCAYIRFSAAYDQPAARARDLGWPVIDMPAGHFHMLVDPLAVLTAILDIIELEWQR